jgi:signal transduction histidine kinase
MEAVGQLTGGIAHDFNNLLSVVLGNLDLAGLAVTDNPSLALLLRRSLEAAERGASLVQRLLAFSRRQTLIPEVTDINSLTTGMMELLTRSLGSAVQLNTRLAPALWPCSIDPGQLEAALLNLAINARDAMPDGGTLTIETRNMTIGAAEAAAQAELQPGDYAQIAVTDTGIGMSREVLERALEPFFTTKAVGKGSGLGLSMVYGFVKQSGGHLNLSSEVGHGTTIEIYLPRAVEAASASGPEGPRRLAL